MEYLDFDGNITVELGKDGFPLIKIRGWTIDYVSFGNCAGAFALIEDMRYRPKKGYRGKEYFRDFINDSISEYTVTKKIKEKYKLE